MSIDWRKYQDDNISVDGLWISYGDNIPKNSKIFRISKRKELEELKKKVKSNKFHGVWIPEIPYQMIKRFTNEGDWIWSIFGGTGIDYEVAKLLNRKCYITDLNPINDYIIEADVKEHNPRQDFKLILAHPPYWDIIKFSDNENDGSNKETLMGFLLWWNDVVKNTIKYIEHKGYFIFACSDVYKNGELINIGHYMKDICLANGLKLKQIIVKDFGEHGKMNSYNLWYYRHLKNGTGFFYGDNIFIFRKEKHKNSYISEFAKVLYDRCYK
jgi:hypothetical protein